MASNLGFRVYKTTNEWWIIVRLCICENNYKKNSTSVKQQKAQSKCVTELFAKLQKFGS